MAQYISVVDQFLRLMALFMPELAIESRARLPDIDVEKTAILSKEKIEKMEKSLNIKDIQEKWVVIEELGLRISSFLHFLFDRPDKGKKKVKVIIAEYGNTIGKAVEDFEDVLLGVKTLSGSIEIEYKQIPDYVVFEGIVLSNILVDNKKNYRFF